MNDSILTTLTNDTLTNGIRIAINDSTGKAMNMAMKFSGGNLPSGLPENIKNIAMLGISSIIIGTIVFFATIFAIAYFYFKTKNKERMAMIEKGIDPNVHNPKSNSSSILKWGFILVGIGLGYLSSAYLAIPAFISMIMFGGIGLISFYFIAPKLNKDK